MMKLNDLLHRGNADLEPYGIFIAFNKSGRNFEKIENRIVKKETLSHLTRTTCINYIFPCAPIFMNLASASAKSRSVNER